MRELAAGPPPSSKQVRALRERLGAATARRVLAVAALQPRARRQLGEGVWWVTRQSLQQATAWQVAEIKAGWLGDQGMIDYCCGIGGDLLRNADRGPVIGVDANAEIAAMAAKNLDSLGSRFQAIVHHTQADRSLRPPAFSVHVDPDRRASGRRTVAVNLFEPSWNEVEDLIRGADAAVVKLAPATQLAGEATRQTHRCWISLSGSVREQSLLFGDASERAGLLRGARSAIRVQADGSYVTFAPAEAPGSQVPAVDQPAAILVDPDSAIRAAGLTELFAGSYRLSTIGGPAGFLTGMPIETADPQPACGALAVVGEVIWSGPFDDRRLRAALRQRDLFPSTIKIRGVDRDPAQLSSRYRRCGSTPATLWLGRNGESVFAALTTALAN